ncbi:MAG: (4Fe-4S)-binding protein, partial [Syntrophus sp. (in: bacteria)]|nr:(4Fe-4S)-binding protein [Syntrophus sp. (in: bacteria)]
MSEVIVRTSGYDEKKLRPLLFEMLARLDGGRIQRGVRVLVKPNLLSPAAPDDAVLTHPLVVKAVCEYVLDKGAGVHLSDSPAMGSFEKILRVSGIGDALRGLDVVCKPFASSVPVDVGKPFDRIEMAEDVLNADMIINLPKLKTHSHMLLTLAVKNMFGCIVGFRKPEWHMRAGVDRDMFARLLVRIHARARPAFAILDGILAMEGEGPGKSGKPRRLGVLMGSQDGPAIDETVCRMIGVDPLLLPTHKAAREFGLIDAQLEIDGRLPRVSHFRLPEIAPLIFGPQALHGFVRRHLVQRPVVDPARCKMCGECWKICPPKAITVR